MFFIFHITSGVSIHKLLTIACREALVQFKCSHGQVNGTLSWNCIHQCTGLLRGFIKKCWKDVSLLFWYFYYFIFMRTYFFPPFPFFASVYILFTASSPEFSWKCSVFSTRILWLSNRVLRHKTLKQRWKRRRDGTDKQGHKALEEWGGEMETDRKRERERVCLYICVCG